MTKTGNPLTGYNVSVSSDYYFYQTSDKPDSDFKRIPKSEVLMLRDKDGNVLDLGTLKKSSNDAQSSVPASQTSESTGTSSTTEVVPTDRFPVIPITKTHEDPLAYGNCVYIATNSSNEYERAGQEYLKKHFQDLCTSDFTKYDVKPYVVVDTPEQAHFILQFRIFTKGFDMAALFIRPREYYNSKPTWERPTDTDDIGYCLAVLQGVNGRTVYNSRSNMEDPKISRALAANSCRYFSGCMAAPKGWPTFWKKYKKDGLFLKPHFRDVQLINLKDITEADFE